MSNNLAKLVPPVGLPVGLGLAVAVFLVPMFVVYCQAREAVAVRECGASLQKSLALNSQRWMERETWAPRMGGKAAPFQALTLGYVLPQGEQPVLVPTVLYIGYMLEDDADLDRFFDYYTSKVSADQPLEDAIPLGNPREDGRDKILRTRSLDAGGANAIAKGWYRDASQIPVFIERMENHVTPGTHVVFLDGHVTFFPHSRSNIWPLTRNAFGKLKEAESFRP